VTALVVALALAAAVTHAGWNLLLAHARDSQAATAVALVTGLVLLAPIAFFAGSIGAGAAPYLIATNVLELVYFVLLARAYDRSDAATIYPVARGLAPVLVLVASVVAGVALTGSQIAGVLAIAAGVVLLRVQRGSGARGVGLGAAVAVCIAGYTLVDKAGLRHADPLPYLAVAMIGPALCYLGLMLARRGGAVVRAELSVRSALAGAGMVGAYGLTLAALARGPAAPVAAIRETSIVVLTILTALVLRRPVTALRWLGSIIVAAGVIAIALG
jgi:drug/metabolite transporter (DMT)-like permease